MKRTRLFVSLQNRSYAWLWTGQSVSLFGLGIYTTCLPFLVFRAGGGAIEISMAQTFFILPQLIFLLFSGVYVDRWPNRTVLMVSDLLRGFAVLGIVALLLSDSLLIWHVYGLTALLGLISTFYRPAVRGIIPQIVEKHQLLSANSLRSISQQVSDMIGPVVGGTLVAATGLYLAYGVNALTFLLSALFLAFVTVHATGDEEARQAERKAHSQAEKGKASFRKDFREGWQAIRSRPWLGASILIAWDE
jgi:DHA3 family macrolide efflux protein-like MFS transporter